MDLLGQRCHRDSWCTVLNDHCCGHVLLLRRGNLESVDGISAWKLSAAATAAGISTAGSGLAGLGLQRLNSLLANAACIFAQIFQFHARAPVMFPGKGGGQMGRCPVRGSLEYAAGHSTYIWRIQTWQVETSTSTGCRHAVCKPIIDERTDSHSPRGSRRPTGRSSRESLGEPARLIDAGAARLGCRLPAHTAACPSIISRRRCVEERMAAAAPPSLTTDPHCRRRRCCCCCCCCNRRRGRRTVFRGRKMSRRWSKYSGNTRRRVSSFVCILLDCTFLSSACLHSSALLYPRTSRRYTNTILYYIILLYITLHYIVWKEN